MTDKRNFAKQNIIAPENWELDTYYSITLNPCDDYQYWSEISDERIKKSKNHMKYLIRRYCNIHMDLYLEISRTGRLHWHGTIKISHINHVREFYLVVIHELMTKHHVDVDTIEDMDKWIEYCTKGIKIINVNLMTSHVIKDKIGDTRFLLQKPIDEY